MSETTAVRIGGGDVGSGGAAGTLTRPRMTSLFCRHNRFTADCPICSKGTVLDPERAAARPRSSGSGAAARRSSGGGSRAAAPSKGARVVTGPYVSAGPYIPDDGEAPRYEVRLERVPGGVRMASWALGQLQRGAPVLATADIPALVEQARERALLSERDMAALEAALEAEPGDPVEFGASAGRSGDLRDELRVEPVGDGRMRVARWIMRPNFGWELQEAPVMLPAKRYAEALRAAVRGGLLDAE
jgi:hypothetical protein